MTTTIEQNEVEIAHRKACAYLKGYIVAAATAHGMEWEGDPARTPEFKEGWEEAQRTRFFTAGLTYIHIIHNRLRHGRPHRTAGKAHYDVDGGDYDQSHIDYMLRNYPALPSRVNNALANMGIDVKSLLSRELV